ncbi:hypothetical protein VOLCADRAFT_91502 [Volvox carteri f. nagariensis]|uniref:Uncharacterized protein n=1 Tax=Volvox carteri f. nagariensis TaxID=3068 RepID=D8TX87_VOLCA|nr:uncharacterized protein VOLCADRAFT_91502 [Volvox carteri f. nagariensis]EFJ47868.1 hypothetical protein VOLCADRAFT_91502 [Volvox carteri f. nagariensis]|eukprot:XP_002950974.1 hypothetical protein VOLCADRAFT_91502 [Volvox carteri f. nagariensis]
MIKASRSSFFLHRRSSPRPPPRNVSPLIDILESQRPTADPDAALLYSYSRPDDAKFSALSLDLYTPLQALRFFLEAPAVSLYICDTLIRMRLISIICSQMSQQTARFFPISHNQSLVQCTASWPNGSTLPTTPSSVDTFNIVCICSNLLNNVALITVIITIMTKTSRPFSFRHVVLTSLNFAVRCFAVLCRELAAVHPLSAACATSRDKNPARAPALAIETFKKNGACKSVRKTQFSFSLTVNLLLYIDNLLSNRITCQGTRQEREYARRNGFFNDSDSGDGGGSGSCETRFGLRKRAVSAATAAACGPPLGPCETVVQLPPADPRVSRAMLPRDYDRRAWLLLARMALSVVLFAVLTSAAVTIVVSLVGVRQLLVLLAAAEAAFAVYFRQRYSALNSQPIKHAPESHDPLRAFNRLLELASNSSYNIDVHDYLSSWFCGADPGTIRQGNLADLIAYGFWYKRRGEMESEGQGPLLWDCVSKMQSSLGFSLPAGYTHGLQVMTHLWEPLRVWYRCLVAADLPVVAVEYKHVSMRLCSIIPSADDIAAAVMGLMDRLEMEQHLHSMFLPSLLANFIYRPPRSSSLQHWIQDVPCRTLVTMAGGDELIHVGAVMEFVRHYAAKVLFHPEHCHAQLLLDPTWQQQLVADVRSMASSGLGASGAREVQRRLTEQQPLQPLAATTPAAAAAAAKLPQRRMTVSELQRLLRQQALQQWKGGTGSGGGDAVPSHVGGSNGVNTASAVRRRWTHGALGDKLVGVTTEYDSGRGFFGGISEERSMSPDDIAAAVGNGSLTQLASSSVEPPASYDILARRTADDEADDSAEMTEAGMAALAEDLRRCIGNSRAAAAAAAAKGTLLPPPPHGLPPQQPPPQSLQTNRNGGGAAAELDSLAGKPAAVPPPLPSSSPPPPAPLKGGGGGGSCGIDDDVSLGPLRWLSASATAPPPDLAARRAWPDLWDRRLLLEFELAEPTAAPAAAMQEPPAAAEPTGTQGGGER